MFVQLQTVRSPRSQARSGLSANDPIADVRYDRQTTRDRRGVWGVCRVNLSLSEKIWLAAGFAFIAYPVGDILGYWDIEAPVVVLCAGLLLVTGWNVGRRKNDSRG